jgi:RNA polymerase sigma-70 factor (ECF subfamily)
MAPQLPPPSPAAHSPVHGPPLPAQAEGAVLPPSFDFPALVVAHHAALYRYAYRLCGCAAEADDLTQQAFLVAQQKLHQVREADRAGAWLFAVLRSCFLKSLRRQRPANAATLNVEVEEFADRTPAVEEIDRERLAAALADLPEEFRLVVLMFYFEDLSYQEIAEQLQIPIGTVMSRLSRGKGHLRKRLTDEPEGASAISPASLQNGANHESAKTSLRPSKPAR